MKKHSQTFKQARRENQLFTPTNIFSTIKLIFIALAFGLICFLSIYFLSVPGTAYELDPILSLDFSGGTIRALYFQTEQLDEFEYEKRFMFLDQELAEATIRDDTEYAQTLQKQIDQMKINFADDLIPEAIDQLFDGQDKWIDSQILIYVTDNAVMNYALDDPTEIIILASVIKQQIENGLTYTPDPLTFLIFNSALAIIYEGRLWTSEGYFTQAQFAIDREIDRRLHESTNEQMRPDRDEEQYYYNENNEKIFYNQNQTTQNIPLIGW